MCFSLLLYSLKWQLSCSCSFVGNIVRSANKTRCFVQMHFNTFFLALLLK
ncbi:hypothetical protein AB205_0138560 [Aquarana catesbeiana]|uniref:Uncharacterized protein n=1 Tax=Aquarana catesbeiana TaxID=8400 RepID=A0A2G9RLQ8_AQUCT|nr:hypothetical protein AB205_0138560 [Aquarana catesbeiana]